MEYLKKVTCMILFLSLFLINFTSASIYYEEGNQTYEIDTWVPTWLGGDGYSNVTLISNTDQCLVNCEFHLSGYNEEPVSLIDEIEFLDRSGNDASGKLTDVSFKLGTYQLVEKNNETYGLSCENISTENGTIQTCDRVLISNNTYEEYEMVWQDYLGEELDGYWELKTTAKKTPNSAMDWVITFRGKRLSEWAWWDSSWQKKREINLTEVSGTDLDNYSMLVYVPYDSDMNVDFSDLRFLDSSETTELNYWIQNSTNSSFAWAWVVLDNLTADSSKNIYMYYGNSLATSPTYSGGISYNAGTKTITTDKYKVTFSTQNVASIEFIDAGTTKNYMATGVNNAGTIGFAQTTSASNSYSLNVNTSGYMKITVSYQVKHNDGGSSVLGVMKEVWEFYSNRDHIKVTSSWTETQAGDVNKYIAWTSGTTDHHYINSAGNWATKTTAQNIGPGDSSENSEIVGLNSLGVGAWLDLRSGYYYGMITKDTLPANNMYSSWATTTSYYYNPLDSQDWGNGIHINNQQATAGALEAYIFYSDDKTKINQVLQPNYTIGSEKSQTGTISVNFVTPPTPINYANISEEEITIEVDATYQNSSLTNISYDFYDVNGTLLSYLYNNETYQINVTFPDSKYHYNVTICGTEYILSSTICASTETRYLNHDVNPPIISVTSPSGTYDYIYEGLTLDLNWTAADYGEGLDSCWYTYAGDTVYLNCSQNTTELNYSTGKNNLTFYANDTFGNQANQSVSLDYIILDYGETYTSTVTETTPNTISRILNIPGDSVSSIVLDYNGTNYTTTLGYSGGNYSVSSTVIAPSVDTDSNITISHYITIGGSTYKTYESTQTIQALNLSSCTGGDVILNLSLFDEETKAELNGTIEINAMLMSVLSGEEVESVLLNAEDVQNVQICLDPISSIINFYLDAYIRYYSNDYATEFYFIKQASLGEYPINVSLFDLNLNSSTEFLLRYRGETLTEIEGAIIQLLRYYTSYGGYETVEAPETSISGTAVAHIDLNTNKYRAIVVKDGEILDIFENVVFDCENELSGQCEQNLYADLTAYNTIGAGSLNDFSYSVSDTGSSLITTFSIPSGSSSSVNVLVTQRDQFGNETACNQTITTSSGSLECEYSETIGDSYVLLEVSKNGEQQFEEEYYVSDSDEIEWGGLNWLAMFVLLLSLSLMAISSPEWIIGNAIITFIIGGALWLVTGMNIVVGLGLLIWLIIAAIILILEIAKQEDR